MKNNEAISYDDILLIPQYSDIKSRTEIDVTTDLGNGLILKSPLLSSPMDTVTGGAMAMAMTLVGGAGVIHRYNTIIEQQRHIKRAIDNVSEFDHVGAAIGVTGNYIDRATAAFDAGATFICIDVAHGHHILVKSALHSLRAIFGNDFHIMAGNVATLEGINDLAAKISESENIVSSMYFLIIF